MSEENESVLVDVEAAEDSGEQPAGPEASGQSNVPADLLERLQSAVEQQREDEQRATMASEAAKAAKKRLEASTDDVVSLARRITGMRADGTGPLFEQMAETAGAPDVDDAMATPLADVLAGEDNILRKLAEADPPIETMGDLADLTTKHGEFWYRHVTGIGEAGAEKVTQITEEWWMGRKDAESDRDVDGADPPEELTDAEG